MAASLLILGGTGFLGRAVLDQLERAHGSPSKHWLAISRSRGELPSDVPFEAWDGSEPQSVTELLRRFAPEQILNCCALARVDQCESDPQRARRMNHELPKELGDACSKRGIRLVHVSTDLVFGCEPPSTGGFREADPAGPVHEYGLSKMHGEAALFASHPQACVARLPLLGGDSRRRGLGATDSLLRALDLGSKPKLFEDEFRTPLDVDCAARALLELLSGEWTGLIHLAGPSRVSRYELGVELLQALGRRADFPQLEPCKRADLGLEAQRPGDVSLNASLAQSRLQTELLSPWDALRLRSKPGPA